MTRGRITAFLLAVLGLAAGAVRADHLRASEDPSTGGVKAQSFGLDTLNSCGIAHVRYRFRCLRAREQQKAAEAANPENGDKLLAIVRNGHTFNVALFSKTFDHNKYGEVSRKDFVRLETAMKSGLQRDFDAIRLAPGSVRKLANPQAAFAVSYIGFDGWSIPMRPAPRFQSVTTAVDMVYVYGQALLRDVPFYAMTNRLTTVEHLIDDLLYDLNRESSHFFGPANAAGKIDRSVLFRGLCPGCLIGPVVSQFLLHDFDYGGMVVQSTVPVLADKAFSVSTEGWLDIQKGHIPPGPTDKSSLSRICNWRTLAAYVHADPPCSAFYNAALLLLELGAPLDPNIRGLKNEAGFLTFGVADILSAVMGACYNAGKAAWRQKWSVNMRLRPEVMAGRVHFSLAEGQRYGIHPLLLESRTVQHMRQYNKKNLGYDTYLLPMVYQEGSPTHPSYPAGHSTFSGAGATILKAFFDDSVILAALKDSHGKPFRLIESVSCAESYTELIDHHLTDPVIRERMTVGGEIDKLAWNIGLARCAAGVHYPTDSEGIVLGEKMAIKYLEDLAQSYNEDFGGFTFRRFDGTPVSVFKNPSTKHPPPRPTFVNP